MEDCKPPGHRRPAAAFPPLESYTGIVRRKCRTLNVTAPYPGSLRQWIAFDQVGVSSAPKSGIEEVLIVTEGYPPEIGVNGLKALPITPDRKLLQVRGDYCPCL